MTSAEKTKNLNGTGNCCKHQSSNGHGGHGKAPNWNTKARQYSKPSHSRCPRHHHKSHHCHKSDSVLSTDSDIRFTRRKLGDSQKCGCAVIAGFLVALLLAAVVVYVGYTYLRSEPLPDRIFRGKFRVIHGDRWSIDLADQNSLRFQHKARDYRERINLIIRRSDLQQAFEGSEVLALDGTEGSNDLVVHFNLRFDPYQKLVSVPDLLAIFSEEIHSKNPKYFYNLAIEPESLTIKEITELPEEPEPIQIPLDEDDLYPTATQVPPRRCEPVHLNYCKSIGYNMTTYPNFMGHYTIEEVELDLIPFRGLVDSECFREAFDFICNLLQPACEFHDPEEPRARPLCREYCQAFVKGCGNRIPEKFKRYFDCELMPESTGVQSCRSKPRCSENLQNAALSPRICDGIADCPDLSDEKSCTFCPIGSLYCGRGRACVHKSQRCDGKADCPDGADEKDCLSVAPLVSYITNPAPIIPYLPKFYPEGYAIFSEKGSVGKLCAEGLESNSNSVIRQTVAESLCKSLGYESVNFVEIRNDTEPVSDYVRVLDPHAAEISFVRTSCHEKKVFFIGCADLMCGMQSVNSPKFGITLPKMASAGDWPWMVALFREDTHVCDGTLVSSDWVLTTESCFQGQPKATWTAVFGTIRLNSHSPWKQRRRIIGMVKSPVEGSTAALVRLETPVVFSDFVRPICLPDEMTRKLKVEINQYDLSYNQLPTAEKLALSEYNRNSNNNSATKSKRKSHEISQFFVSPLLQSKDNKGDSENDNVEDDNNDENVYKEKLERTLDSYPTAEHLDNVEIMPKAEALTQEKVNEKEHQPYPIPEETPQTKYYKNNTSNPQSLPLSYITPKGIDQTWTNCNTLGWSTQRDHLQRVQLKIGDMASCENISIATVNSMCTEAAFQKYDCTEEEFAGSPVQCLFPETNQWALIGVSSWRIACAPLGVERPRMYDKITSNAAWIRDTINSI